MIYYYIIHFLLPSISTKMKCNAILQFLNGIGAWHYNQKCGKNSLRFQAPRIAFKLHSVQTPGLGRVNPGFSYGKPPVYPT